MATIKQARLFPWLTGVFVCTLAWTLGASSSFAQELLQWKYHPGDEFEVLVSQDIAIEQDHGTQIVNIQYRTDVDSTALIEEANAQGEGTLLMTINRIAMEMHLPETPLIEVSSDVESYPDPITERVAAGIRPLAGLEIRQKFDSCGELLESEIDEDAAAALEELSDAGGGMLSAEDLMQLFEQSGVVLPAEAVAIGDTWQQEKQVPNPLGSIAMSIEYTHQGFMSYQGVGCAVIGSVVTMEFLDTAGNDLGFDVTITDQQVEGTCYFAFEEGRFVAGTMESTMAMTVVGMGVRLEQVVTSTVEMSMRPLESE